MPGPIAVNYHLLVPCDSRCRFCFATFRDIAHRPALRFAEAARILDLLRAARTEKLTFAGGEPTLYKDLGRLLLHARGLGFTTGVVTNGFKLGELLDGFAPAIDWVGLSVDSASETVQAELGRGHGRHVATSIELADRCRELGVRVKLNTVVTALTWGEDMAPLVLRMRPERWKVFQVLRVEGQNDGDVESLLVTADQFAEFVARHAHLGHAGIEVVPEDNEAMTDSYAMIDPAGRFFSNSGGVYGASRPILEVGVEDAVASVGFDEAKLVARGGRYDWAAIQRS